MNSSSPNIGTMLNQSLAVLSRPSVATFERFERSGGLREAYTYVLIAALVGAVISGFFGIFHQDVNPLVQFFSRLISVLIGFGVFTGAVHLIGRNFFRGTGTYPEVAYTYALFYVPLSIIGSVIGVIPILGWLALFLIAILNVFFGWLAVQSSMNIRDQVQAGITLLLSGVAYWMVSTILLTIVLSALFLNR
ncbi:YIP1 family protein [Deinococcus maricopensis]|uniref:Yip1 domain-containing protein n=1 Tax=Deinococcus maricopensis (strain DSM 21211 / LMG 22137 / NRRL B-23946 / LB-34) TaxID=709986 RepID=E8U401_DEIML|nr:YIP1 family protein [Deinococcus maricopensis]ADV65695.1 hypothetical protein Deima_0031 [Deinococcus maricopensis DSM 21211]